MPSDTSFSSAAASGSDWRDTSKAVLEKLEAARKSKPAPNFGFLYITDFLAEDATSIFNLFRSVLGIENWVGCVGVGVISEDGAFIDKPAISALIGYIPEDHFRIFSFGSDVDLKSEHAIEKWLNSNTALLGIVHGDPTLDNDPILALENLERILGGFLVGGFGSSRTKQFQIADGLLCDSISGVIFSSEIPVATTLSQGCQPISDFCTITKSDERAILEIDHKPALEIFQKVLRQYAAKKLGKPLPTFEADIAAIQSSEHIPEEYIPLFQGQIHVALPLNQSDQKDYMVRSITSMSIDEGSFSISQDVPTGRHILFVERTQEAISCDLSKSLVTLRERILHEHGCFKPKAALYVSCVARVPNAKENHDEIRLIREIIGDIPLTGFYASGEINNGRLYGYTGVLTVFF